MTKSSQKPNKDSSASDANTLVTVITPFYHNASTIFRTLDSLLSQTYAPIEYILVNDGSDDFDAEAIAAYIEKNKTERLVQYKILENETNQGTVKALNHALSVANGAYIFSLAADDAFFDERVIEDWVAAFLETGADVLTARRAVYDENLETFLFSAPNEKEIECFALESPQKQLQKMSGANMAFGACTAYSARCYEIVGGKLDERYRLIEDYPFNLKLLRAGVPIRFFDRTVIRYRWGGLSNFNNVNEAYLKDSDRIFRQESYPFAPNKMVALRSYYHWKFRLKAVRDEANYRKRFDVAAGGKGKAKYRFLMLLKHPFYMLKKYFS